MLKTTSKQAKENIRNYIIEHFDFTNYETTDTPTPSTWEDIASCIMKAFVEEYQPNPRHNLQLDFESWCQGLPSILDTCYYYNRSAVEDLGAILEETNAEKNKHTEQQAEQRLTYLIFRELKAYI